MTALRFPPPPAGTPVEQLGSGGTKHQHRNAFDPVCKLIDEVEEIVVRPVKIFEDQDERSTIGECFEEAAPRRKGLCPAIATCFDLAGKADERSQVRL